MITHIVFWQLKPEGKEQNALQIKERLEALPGVIPGLLEAEVNRNKNGGEFDLCLLSRFESMKALHAYERHPEHLKIRAFVRSVIDKRAAVDF